MAIQEVNPISENSKKGSGVLGSVVGALAGLGLGAITGGLAAPVGAGIGATIAGTAAGAAGGASVGETVGGIAGNAIDPAQSADMIAPIRPVQSENRMNAMMKAPEVQMAGMQNAKNLLATSNIPNASDYMSMLDQAQGKMKQQLGSNSFIG